MIPEAFVRHQTTGRLRITIPSRKRDQEYLTGLKERFSGFEGIETVELNPITGSVLIIHKVSGEKIAEYALANSLFSLKGLHSSPVTLQQRVTGTFKSVDAELKTFTGGEIDIGGLAFLVLMGAGIYQLSVGNLTALPWYGAFWYALNIFLKSSSVKA
ncbi:MAG: HMA2 domain-containing protein [Thermodesulfovibrionales bacterium]|jgi:hypothetical protein